MRKQWIGKYAILAVTLAAVASCGSGGGGGGGGPSEGGGTLAIQTTAGTTVSGEGKWVQSCREVESSYYRVQTYTIAGVDLTANEKRYALADTTCSGGTTLDSTNFATLSSPGTKTSTGWSGGGGQPGGLNATYTVTKINLDIVSGPLFKTTWLVKMGSPTYLYEGATDSTLDGSGYPEELENDASTPYTRTVDY